MTYGPCLTMVGCVPSRLASDTGLRISHYTLLWICECLMMSGHGWPCLIQGVVGLLSFCSSDVRPAGLALVVFLGLYLSVA